MPNAGVPEARWTEATLHNTLSSINSCRPCTETKAPQDSPLDVRKLDITFDDSTYYVDAEIAKAGTYDIVGAVLTQSSFRVSMFTNADFTGLHGTKRLAPHETNFARGGLRLIMDPAYAEFFRDKKG